ncbi:hypothetical protein F511_23979 [Dorcoceras hygrometricum]|uniref:Uncharacterized protein n=1 Tax=Dorcoceras hygrometricum TaxID=472368 RepID=A0A2Z7D1K3_9LAMI|nr:hypothetical protein F511_23979 [Dorcoceras hygrometricum]
MVSERTSLSTVLFGDEPSGSWWACEYSIQIVDSISIPSSDTVVEAPVVDTETNPTVDLDISQLSQDADLVSPSSYSDSPMHFTTDDIPLGDEPNAVLPPDLTAELHSSVLQWIRFPLSIADNQERDARVQTEIFRKEVKDQKAALSKEFEEHLAVIPNDLLEFRVETQEHYTTLRDNLAELIAFFNMGLDYKKGEVGSSQGQGLQPPPGNRNKPGGRGGSRSEPAKKRGSGSQSSSRQRGFRYWFGG